MWTSKWKHRLNFIPCCCDWARPPTPIYFHPFSLKTGNFMVKIWKVLLRPSYTFFCCLFLFAGLPVFLNPLRWHQRYDTVLNLWSIHKQAYQVMNRWTLGLIFNANIVFLLWICDRSYKMMSFTWYSLCIGVPSETIHTFRAWTVWSFFNLLFVKSFFYYFNFASWSPIVRVASFFPFVFACSPLMWSEQQVRHHQTGGPHTPTASAPPLLLWPLHPALQQGPQAIRGLRNGASIASLPAPIRPIHPIPVVCVYALGLLHQPSSSTSATCLVPVLLLGLLLPLLPPCPGPSPAVGVQHTHQPVLHWECLWGGDGAEAGPVGESGWSPTSAVKWVSCAPPSQQTSRPFYFWLLFHVSPSIPSGCRVIVYF